MTALQINPDNFNGQLFPGSIKAAMHISSAGSRDLWQVPIGNLKIIDGFNVRNKDASYAAHIRWLADSMLSEGFYQSKPVSGYVAKEGDEQIIYIFDGHCRLEAALLANSEGAEITKIPVVVSQAGVSMEDLTVVLVRGNGGKPLAPFEIGVVCKRLIGYGMEDKEIAKRLGFTTSYVNGLLKLMAAPLPLRKMVIDGVASASTVIEAMFAHGEKALEVLLAAQVIANNDGKERITKKHTTVTSPAFSFKKIVRKQADTLYLTVKEVKSDPGYQNLSSEVREKLDALLLTIGETEKDENE